MQPHGVHLIIITGMSGAGKTVAIQALEDLGYFCVDNLPPVLIPKFVELVEQSSSTISHVALVLDLRGREFFDGVYQTLEELNKKERFHVHILFLEANDEVLVKRYKETRRRHPLANQGSPLDGIRQEREMLKELKGLAQVLIDTSHLKPAQLRQKIIQSFSKNQHAFTVNIISFGFKYGIPIDADLVFDVRFLPNPHYLDDLRPKTGLDEEVAHYVLKWNETKEFLNKLIELLSFLLPYYKREGKSQLVIAVGCTGGKHRSVTVAEELGRHFAAQYPVEVTHRDKDKERS